MGNYRDSKDPVQLDKYKITHILSIHDAARRVHSVSKNLPDIKSFRKAVSFSSSLGIYVHLDWGAKKEINKTPSETACG